MLSKKEKEVLRSLVKYHLDEVKRDRDAVNEEIIALLGAEVKYEAVLKSLLKKLK
ncbi:hypothetical protein JXB27_00115 [Candidatus Woesearchaeota archaeon]|nr:hypothetical protein [Candidatus Woesearchaeota archaeon]